MREEEVNEAVVESVAAELGHNKDPEPIKRCPFCGGSGLIKTRMFDVFDVVAYVECADCKARTNSVPAGVKYTAIDKAVELWNRRVGED